MLLRIEQSKGRKDRQAMLSSTLLTLLRAWWREGQRLGKMVPGGWLFPGMNPVNPMTPRGGARRHCQAGEFAFVAPCLCDTHTLREVTSPLDLLSLEPPMT